MIKKKVNPAVSDGATTSNTTNNHHEAGSVNSNCGTGRCGVGESCVCEFYAEWECEWDFPQDTPTQLRRRRLAALRCTPLASGRRDPISATLGRWSA